MKALLKLSITAGAVALAMLGAGPANAAVFNPFDVAAPGAGNSTYSFTADKITGNYNETVTFDKNGTFHVALYWSAGQFVGNGGKTPYNAITTGLGLDYGLYALYTAAGTYRMNGKQTVFSFAKDSGALAMYLDRGVHTKVTLPGTANGSFALTGDLDDTLLATGDPQTGMGMLDPTLSTCVGSGGSGINCGSFGSTTTFDLTSNGEKFFVKPNPFYDMSFQSGHLNNFTPSGTQNINGSLDVVFDGLPTPPSNPVPEPASLALLGLGLVGVGAARRGKRK